MWSGKFMAGYGIKGYYVLMTGNKEVERVLIRETQESNICDEKKINHNMEIHRS